MKQHIQEQIQAMQSCIEPLEINGLRGRMLRIASKKHPNHEILMIYGHHSSLERMFGLAEDLAQYGTVTMPDLPGFGGMDSFYRIGMEPTLDNLADYLATFVKLKYRRKKLTIAAMSLGFVVATRMLQRYPELTSHVDILVSVVGFSHRSDFTFSRSRYLFYRYGATFFSWKLPSKFFYNVCLHPSLLRAVYSKMHNAKHKFDGADPEEKKRLLEFEVHLWRANDVRTYMYTTKEMLTLDNCHKQIALPVYHIKVAKDQYFDQSIVEQHLRVIYLDYTSYTAVMPNHAPSIIASKEEAAPLFPEGIRTLLKKVSKS